MVRHGWSSTAGSDSRPRSSMWWPSRCARDHVGNLGDHRITRGLHHTDLGSDGRVVRIDLRTDAVTVRFPCVVVKESVNGRVVGTTSQLQVLLSQVVVGLGDLHFGTVLFSRFHDLINGLLSDLLVDDLVSLAVQCREEENDHAKESPGDQQPLPRASHSFKYL